MLMACDAALIEPAFQKLTELHPVAVYICEPRGFGYSSGKRGKASSKTSVLEDVRSFVRLIKNNSDRPIFLSTNMLSLKPCYSPFLHSGGVDNRRTCA